MQGPGILVALKATEQFFWFVQRVLLFIRGNKNEHRNSVFLYYVSVCIRNSQKVCVDVLGGFCFVFKMPPNWANNIKMRMACGSLNGCELNSHLSSALCTAALLSIYYVVCRLKESCKKFFSFFNYKFSLFLSSWMEIPQHFEISIFVGWIWVWESSKFNLLSLNMSEVCYTIWVWFNTISDVLR